MPSAAVAHPLGPPTVTGSEITVDVALNQPTRITRMIMDLTLERFIADRLFTSAGGVTGGAVIYDEVAENELYTSRDVQRVEPGAEFPIVTSERRVPKVAEVEKWGGKIFITDEARDRNNTAEFTRQIRQLSNTIVRKINQRAVAVLEAAIADNSRDVTGNNWGAVVTGGASQTNASGWPAADIAAAQEVAERDELGFAYDTLILNPQEMTQLQIIYGNSLQDMLDTFGITEVYVSNRVTPGQAYVAARGQVGQMWIEKPLGTETWRDPDREQTWVQASVRPLMFVDNKFALVRLTGLAG